ncbi:MAG: PAS domain S-box protein [Candidatus Delongbacteria bacterium]|nr:PAS domain S-box protein [Candidatus Delongbacteria bacterium]MBN2833548.1 PAS domain S-box protein [Candidatus Delongbacteria bacterium]
MKDKIYISELRKRAEDIFNNQNNNDSEVNENKDEIQRIMEELSIYHIELELQNQELQEKQNLLEKEKKKFLDIYKSAPIGYLLINKEGIIIEANDNAELLFGKKNESIKLTPFIVFLRGNNINLFFNHLKSVFTAKDDSNKNLELSIVTRRGHIKSLRLISNLHDENYCRTIIEDITDLKASEERVKKLNERLEASMSAGNIAWWEVELPSGNVKFNENKSRMLGYQKEQFNTYKDFMNLVHPEDYDNTMKAMTDLLTGKKRKYECEYRICNSNGEYMWFYDVGQITVRNGEYFKITGIVTNITERKKSEIELKERENKLRSIFSNSISAIALVDTDGRYLEINRRYEEITELKREEIIGQKLGFITYGEDCENVKSGLSDILSGKIDSYDDTTRIIVKSGKTKWIKTHGKCFYNTNSDVEYIHIEFIDITQEKELELELLRSKEQYRLAMDGIDDGLWDWNLVNNTLYFSPKWKNVIGYEDHELENSFETFQKLLHPNDKERILDRINKFLEDSRGLYSEEFRFEHKNGHYIWILARGKGVFDSLGRMIRISGTHRDITKSKEAEIRVEEQKNFLKLLIDSIPIPIYFKGLDGRYNGCNDAFELLIGKQETEIIGKTVFDLYPTDLAETYFKQDKYLFENVDKQIYESYVKDEGNKYREVIFYKASLVDIEGNITGLVGSVVDISERKKFEENILKLSKAIEQSPATTVITDTEGNIEYANRRFCEITGYSLDEVKGRNPRILKSGKQEQKIYIDLWDSIRNGDEWKGLFHNKKKDGEYYWESATIVPIKNESGSIINYLKVGEDVTKRLEYEEELKRNQKKLQNILNTFPDDIYLINDKHEVVYYNESVARKLRQNPNETLCYKAIYGLDDVCDWCVKGKIAKQGDVQRTVYYDDKNDKHFNVYVGLVEEGLTLSVLHDVTDIKKAELKVVESEKKYKELFESNTESITIFPITQNGPGKFLDCNLNAMKLIGYTKEELMNLSPLDIEVEITEDLKNKRVSTISKDGIIDIETKIKNKNGSIIDVAIKSVLIDLNGKPAIMNIARDITEFKRNQEKVELNAHRVIDLLELSQYKPETATDVLNKGLETALKITKSEMGFIHFYDESKQKLTFASWSEKAMDECKMNDFERSYDLNQLGLLGESVRRREPVIVNDYLNSESGRNGVPKGHVKIKNFLSIPYFEKGKIVSIIAVSNKKGNYDNDDQLQLTLLMNTVWSIYKERIDDFRIRELVQKLEISNQTKDKFFSIIAHDLRNPFTSIIGFTDLVIDSYEVFEKKNILKYIEIISNSANSAYKLLENLLEWSRSQTGSIVFSPELVYIDDKIIEIYDSLKSLFEKKNLIVEFDIKGSNTLSCDPNMISTILRNLITNAIKFTPINGRIEISSEELEDEFLFVVKDNGVGMDDVIKNKLFKIEEKVSSLGTENEKGTGLGLLLCKEFVTKHSGKIWVESEVNQGSSFCFTIPKKIDMR